MPKRPSTGLSKRDMFGVSHGQAGKGDKTRVSDIKKYNKNLSEIDFPHDNAGFERKEGKLVKRYGTTKVTVFERSPAGFIH